MLVRPVFLFLLAGLFFAGACQISDVLDADGAPDFGDAYFVVREPDPPRIDAEGLHLDVRSSGGCARHDYRLRHRRRGDVAEVWIVHDANGDMCEALVGETLTFALPADVLAAATVVLLTPGGDALPLL